MPKLTNKKKLNEWLELYPWQFFNARNLSTRSAWMLTLLLFEKTELNYLIVLSENLITLSFCNIHDLLRQMPSVDQLISFLLANLC